MGKTMNDYLRDRAARKNGLLPKLEFKKPKKAIAKIGKKKLEEMKANKGSDSELDLWFVAQRKKMKGVCFLCGGKSEKDNDETYRRSIHHLLDKRKNMFPSVATHDDNGLEVCFYGNSCHTNIHNGKITFELLKDSKEWDVIKEKLLNILPMVAEAEKKNKLYDKLTKLIYSK
jgi:hypothetical protein